MTTALTITALMTARMTAEVGDQVVLQMVVVEKQVPGVEQVLSLNRSVVVV